MLGLTQEGTPGSGMLLCNGCSDRIPCRALRWAEFTGRRVAAQQGFVEAATSLSTSAPARTRTGELVQRAPDAILTIARLPTRAARARTSTVPIVLNGGQDAVAEDFAERSPAPAARSPRASRRNSLISIVTGTWCDTRGSASRWRDHEAVATFQLVMASALN
jgi:hypothetical protein